MISNEEVKHIARLARLELSEEELLRFGNDLTRILEYVEQLNRVNTATTAPLSGGTELTQQVRSDRETEESKELCNPETAAALINAAPAKQDGYVKVKSVF